VFIGGVADEDARDFPGLLFCCFHCLLIF
jgi:hypothetical protein